MKGKRFLVVDDSSAVADFVRTVIELEGGVVVLAATAAHARERLHRDGPFDLLLLDVDLPDLTGWELLATEQDLLTACKVVIFSAQMSEGRIHESGAALALIKPVAATVLRDALVSVLHPAAER